MNNYAVCGIFLKKIRSRNFLASLIVGFAFYHLYTYGASFEWGFLFPFFTLSAGGSESGSASSQSGTASASGNVSIEGNSTMSQSTFSEGMSSIGGSVSNYDGYSTASFSDGSSATWSGSSSGGSSGGGSSYSQSGYGSEYSQGRYGGSSTPFLKVWDGTKFVYENDVLFGKPNTAYKNYETGLEAYLKGIGGDTYVIQTNPAEVEGKIRFQIKEIEPEESYIDKLSFHAVDLEKDEHLVVDADLEQSYVVNTNAAVHITPVKVEHHHARRNFAKTSVSLSQEFGLGSETGGLTLEKNDQIHLTFRRSDLVEHPDTDVFILLNSYYRDWTLGNDVPFSNFDKLAIWGGRAGSIVARPATIAGLLLGTLLGFGTDRGHSLSIPEANADAPYSQPNYYNQGRYGGGTGRSLEVSIQYQDVRHYIQTIFPRYVKASEEVVKVPLQQLLTATDEFVTVVIKATKKHKLMTSFLFSTKTQAVEYKELPVESIVSKDGADVTSVVANKDDSFLHTKSGDTYDITVSDMGPISPNKKRRYVIKTNGFYTPLSDKSKISLGDRWYSDLAAEDKCLLRNLKRQSL